MAEIPEHLLRRSRERRAALSGEEAPAEPSGEESTSSEAAPAKVEAAAPAAPLPRVSAAPPPEPEGPPVGFLPAGRRRMSMWGLPVMAVLPFFAFFYAQAFQNPPPERPSDPLVLGEEIYRSAGCGGCHGATGGGGVGPAVAGGESVLTFPDEEEHIAWVRTGSATVGGQPYGDPNREGGQRVATGGMPGFAGSLSEEEIEAVVAYEREKL